MWLRRASELGHGPSQTRLGWCLANGEGAGVDVDGAEHWWLQARMQGESVTAGTRVCTSTNALAFSIKRMIRDVSCWFSALIGDGVCLAGENTGLLLTSYPVADNPGMSLDVGAHSYQHACPQGKGGGERAP
jgi:hypothetical protein